MCVNEKEEEEEVLNEEVDEEWRAEDVNKRMKEYKEILDTFQPFEGVV